MRQNARLIIPLWGRAYADKLTSMTLPALLAPGNLPALCAMFNVEVVIVTETSLFAIIRSARSYQSLAALCSITLTPIDDLLSNLPGDYGVVLTTALYRGFLDLGEKVTETFLLFLNADFILADGSYRHLGKLMLAGHRVIHSPSFRVVLEEVWPKLEARVDPETAVLAVSPRELTELALAHKHLTVKARTVNQQLYHQWCMDQFYWYVDEDTFIGYQWPVALVAIRPERIVTKPSLVWDFAYLPDAAPTLERYFITDSDDFFMLEPQSKLTGEELIRPGWISLDEIAKFLSDWTTKEQRECGNQLLIVHSRDLPAQLDSTIGESRRYMGEIARRLSPQPQSHISHRMLGATFSETSRRISEAKTSGSALPAQAGLSNIATITQEKLFGSVPSVRRTHPLWLDTADVVTQLSTWHRCGRNRMLWLSSKDSLFRRVMPGRAQSPQLLPKASSGAADEDVQYDACLCELSLGELSSLRTLYGSIRQLVADGGEILIYVHTLAGNPLRASPLQAYDDFLPALDVSTIHFRGNRMTGLIRKLYFRGSRQFAHKPRLRMMMAAITLLALAPFAWLCNSQAARADPSRFRPGWTSAVLHFVVKKRPQALPEPENGRIRQESQPRPLPEASAAPVS